MPAVFLLHTDGTCGLQPYMSFAAILNHFDLVSLKDHTLSLWLVTS